jgi:hypothetical protein
MQQVDRNMAEAIGERTFFPATPSFPDENKSGRDEVDIYGTAEDWEQAPGLGEKLHQIDSSNLQSGSANTGSGNEEYGLYESEPAQKKRKLPERGKRGGGGGGGGTSVRLDPTAIQVPKFRKGDKVSMSIIENMRFKRGVFTIEKARNNKDNLPVYQLMDNGILYNSGAWVQERSLSLSS